MQKFFVQFKWTLRIVDSQRREVHLNHSKVENRNSYCRGGFKIVLRFKESFINQTSKYSCTCFRAGNKAEQPARGQLFDAQPWTSTCGWTTIQTYRYILRLWANLVCRSTVWPLSGWTSLAGISHVMVRVLGVSSKEGVFSQQFKTVLSKWLRQKLVSMGKNC